MRKIFILILLLLFFVSSTFAQKQYNFLDINTNLFKNADNYFCYITYKISYNKLVFVKNNGSYSAGLELLLEVSEEDSIVTRESIKKDIEIEIYDRTKSKNDYLSGYCLIELKSGSYQIQPTFFLNNTEREGSLKPIYLTLNADSSQNYLEPIVLEKSVACNDSGNFNIANFGKNIPYSHNTYNLLVRDSAKINKVELWQKDELIKSEIPENVFNCSIEECDGNLILTEDNKIDNYSVILKDVNEYLKEGKYTVISFSENDSISFTGKVKWFDMPVSLYDPEFAINLLSTIFDKSKVNDLLDYPEEEYYNQLHKFWAQLDQNKETTFNELMYEFYNRADYAIKEFKSVNNNNGASSVMGRIFIRYGNPDNIERTYSENYKTVEIWKYEELNKEFVFVDKNGLGNFELVK